MNLLGIVTSVVALAVIIIIYNSLLILFSYRLRIVKNIYEIAEDYKKLEDDDPYSLPFKKRIIIPLLKRIERFVINWTPSSFKEREKELLKLAGYPHNLNLQEWIVIRMSIWLIIGLLLTSFGVHFERWSYKIFIIGLGSIFGYLLPIFYLQKQIAVRRAEIERDLPYVLDILTVSVEAGLGFDSALIKVVEKTDGTLANEFNKTLQEIKMGKTRREALKDLGERTGVEDMVQFVGSIIQAEQLGVRLGSVLRVQSEDMRQKKKQRAEEKAMKAPIKILFPLVLFIFPAIFIIILGPAIINILDTMLK
ncbi:type II secretion system F family protein [Vulcanibacillus modesticaldus]|nr:type II secretion system F family protein [Vulcanibacillus modesticaldus]